MLRPKESKIDGRCARRQLAAGCQLLELNFRQMTAMSSTTLDFSRVCRVCCNEGPTLPLFRVNLHRKVMSCAAVQVNSKFNYVYFKENYDYLVRVIFYEYN